MTEIKLGTFEIKKAAESSTTFALLLWGPSGGGKTTLASTAPGVKLWVLFDPGGTDSIADRDDVLVLDLSQERHSVVEKFTSEDPFGMEKMLKDHSEIETLVFDSATTYAALATEAAVANIPSAKLNNPGPQGYGARNAYVLRALSVLMRLAKRQNKNFIIIAHEDAPTKDDQGVIRSIEMNLGGKMANQLGATIGEMWHLSDTGKKTTANGKQFDERRIAVRPCRMRTTMKTRIFNADVPEFNWLYDPLTKTGEGISDWYRKWREAGGKKIPLPK